MSCTDRSRSLRIVSISSDFPKNSLSSRSSPPLLIPQRSNRLNAREFQSVVFVRDVKIKKWGWKTLHYEEIYNGLDDERKIKTSYGEGTEELEFHVDYRLLKAITDFGVRANLPLNYNIWVSSNGKYWSNLTGPRKIYVRRVDDEQKIKEILGEKPTGIRDSS